MMAEPVAIWSGSFELMGVEVKCRVLDNGRRIVDVDFDSMDEEVEFDEEELKTFMAWLRGARW